MNINIDIANMFYENYNDKIIRDANIDEYISSFKKTELERLYELASVIDNDTEEFSHAISLSLHPKKVIKEDFIKNIEKIYHALIKNTDTNTLKQLEVFLKLYKEDLLVLDTGDNRLSIMFFEFLRNFNLAKIKYEKKERLLYIYTPYELRNILKKIVKDKKVKKQCMENTIFKDNIHNIMSAYGVLPLDKFLSIYNNAYGKTNKRKIINRIIVNRAFDEEISIALGDDTFIYIHAFDNEDDALGFYYSLPEDLEYKKFSALEYGELGDGVYHHKFEEYGKLVEFLKYELDMNEDDVFYFDESYILDYMYSYQLDAEEAKKNLNSKLNNEFNFLILKDKIFITSTILSLAKKYPNFNYKGYSLIEKH